MPHPGSSSTRRILLRVDAPPQPPTGAACTGCGLCCAWAPCPVGMLVSRRRLGRCRALVWAGGRYRCGLLASPRRFVPWLPGSWVRRLAGRWIAAGRGCDAELAAG